MRRRRRLSPLPPLGWLPFPLGPMECAHKHRPTTKGGVLKAGKESRGGVAAAAVLAAAAALTHARTCMERRRAFLPCLFCAKEAAAAAAFAATRRLRRWALAAVRRLVVPQSSGLAWAEPREKEEDRGRSDSTASIGR